MKAMPGGVRLDGGGRSVGHYRAFGVFLGSVVFEYYAQEWFAVRQHDVVSLGSVLKFEYVGGEILQVDASAVHQLLEGLHITFFGPAHVSCRVVYTFFLVIEVVAAGTIRAGHAQFQFFFVIIRVAVKSCGYCAQYHYATFAAAYCAGKIDGIERRSCCGNEHCIDAATVSIVKNFLFDTRVIACQSQVGAVF